MHSREDYGSSFVLPDETICIIMGTVGLHGGS
jgi:hypothetical protein